MDIAAASPANQEVELKLAIGSPSARSVADRELGRAPERSLETIYFDTPRRRLHAAGYSLRLRRDGETWSQSIKGGGPITRYEKEHALLGGLPDFSLLEGTPIAGLIGGGERLAPVFLTRVKRRSRRRVADGGRIELCLDEGVVIARDRTWPIHELELELKAGDQGILFDEGRRLASGEAFIPAFMSKAERGYALADGLLGEAVRFGERPLDPDTPALAAFQQVARRCLRQLSLNAEVMAVTPRGEPLHLARTGARRLRVALLVFRPLLDDERVAHFRDEVGWLMSELADARNLDVFMTETFEPGKSLIADRTAIRKVEQRFASARVVAEARANAALASPRFRLLLLDAARWVEGLEPTESEGDAAHFAAEALAERRRAFRGRLEALDWRYPRARHKLRIDAKKMRYSSEFFIDLGPKSRVNAYRPFIKKLARVQEQLGLLSDLAVIEPMLAEILSDPRHGPAATVDEGYAAGLLLGGPLARRRKRIKRARRASQEFVDAPVWW